VARLRNAYKLSVSNLKKDKTTGEDDIKMNIKTG
jgi:hypothetical protein